jgi:hypothetical protein
MAIKIEPSKFFQVSLISLVIITIVSWLVNQFAPGTLPAIKFGWIFLLFGLVIFLVTLWQFGTNINSIKIKDIIFMLLVLGLIVVLYIFLPQFIPQIFSIHQIKDFFTETLGSIGGSMGTGIV